MSGDLLCALYLTFPTLLLLLAIWRCRLPEWMFPLRGKWLRWFLSGLLLLTFVLANWVPKTRFLAGDALFAATAIVLLWRGIPALAKAIASAIGPRKEG